MAFVTRFAPSPTGPLHLGHAYSALLAFDMARAEGGVFLLRIEDIDQSRCRPEWEAQIYDDLHWLGIDWATPVIRQSERHVMYQEAASKLWNDGLLYRCSCSRQDIRMAASAPQEGTTPVGPDGLVYPGTCRTTPRHGSLPLGTALRLDAESALAGLSDLRFLEQGNGAGVCRLEADEFVRTVGDPVILRRDMETSYHLSVVVDDASQGVTHVVRGADLAEATWIHVLLQRLLGLTTPVYHHHRLIRDEAGKRLAKRDDARALSKYRSEGATPADIRRMVGL